MNTGYLKTFIEVVNEKSFSKAAEQLFITQPAVTKQIKMLEKEFGAVLLQRNGAQVEVTKEGQEFYKYAASILNKEEELYAKFFKDKDELSGVLNIYSSSLPANYLLDQIVYEFSNKYKNISYMIKKVDSKRVYQNVETGHIGFGFTGTKKNKKNIAYIQIAEDELVLALPAHKFSHLKDTEVNLAFLMEQDLIIRSNGSATLNLFEKAILSQGFTLKDFKVKAIIEDNEIIKKMVEKGIGVSVMSRLSIEKEVKDKLIIPLKIKDINLRRGIYYIYSKNRYFSSIDEQFKEFMITRFAMK